MSNKQILIADDEVSLRFLLSETLGEEGYEIIEAEDGRQAVEQLQARPFDLVILDYMMPELTGVEVCQWLRGSENPNRNSPVILLTAKAQEKDRERAQEVGVSTYMIKPFSPIQLLDVVDELINNG